MGDDQALIDAQLMRELGWTWNQIEAVPVYVRRYCARRIGGPGR